MSFQFSGHDRSIRRRWRASLTILCLSSSLIASSASADPTLGVGIAFVPGAGWAVGIKAISDDEEKSSYVSLGIDYIISGPSRTHWRPNLGIGYESTSIFNEINVGYTVGDLDVGLSAGYVDNEPIPFRAPKSLECEPNCIDRPT